MSKPEHSPLPKCVITGRIAGDVFACGDCPPCVGGFSMVPREVKDLLSERDEFANKYANEAGERDLLAEAVERDKAAIAELVQALEQLVAWKEPVEICAPQLGGALKAMYHAEHIIAKHKAVKP